jgi:microsomal dipeptidase-like Zn-dependent dipeptidase
MTAPRRTQITRNRLSTFLGIGLGSFVLVPQAHTHTSLETSVSPSKLPTGPTAPTAKPPLQPAPTPKAPLQPAPTPKAPLQPAPTAPAAKPPIQPSAPVNPSTPVNPSPAPKLPGGSLPPIGIENWGFEHGLHGWEKTGNAFDHQPTLGDNVAAKRVINASTSYRMPLEGDYWHDVGFPVGHKGAKWVGTYERRPNNSVALGTTQGDGLTGTLTSKAFTIDKGYITFLVSGGRDATRLRVELLEQHPSGTINRPDGKYRVVPGTVKTGHNHELLRREWWDVRSLKGKTARVRIVDESTGGWGHINVDDFQFQDRSPNLTRVPLGKRVITQVKAHVFRQGDGSTLGFVDWDAPVWGVADLHTHPASHLGFGKKLMHGAPDGDIAKELGSCNATHGGWGLDNTGGNYLRMIVITMMEKIYKYTADLDHPHDGYPNFKHWPHFTTITHQQMRVEWMRRAHQGGLRTIVGLAVNNHLLAEVIDGDTPKDDKRSANLQIAFMKAFVARHKDFMEIALTPADLRDIVRRGKLAVILGIEVDTIGNMNFANVSSNDSAIRNEVKRLHDQGIRYIFPIHVTDNPFGGAAVYETIFNYANRFSAVQPAPPHIGAKVQGTAFQIERAPDHRVNFRMEDMIENVFVIGLRAALDGISQIPSPVPFTTVGTWLDTQSEYRVLKEYFLTPDLSTEHYKLVNGGHRNKKGLTASGKFAIREMMKYGMIIDIDHMSEKSVSDTLEIAKMISGGYPVVSGHNGFRAVAHHNSENQRSEQQARDVLELGGIMGIGYGYEKSEGRDPTFAQAMGNRAPSWTTSKVADTCGGSSRRFAQQYLYALEQMAGWGVALGTDINGLVAGPGPRFGANARYDGNRCLRQTNPVAYKGVTVAGTRDQVPLVLGKTGNRVWNINNDGVAHYGMLPDFFQDLTNVGVLPSDLSPLFGSSEALAQTWEKALRVAP